MSNEQLKERIKLKSEFLKFYFILLLAVSTALLALITKDNDIPSKEPVVILGIGAFIVILILIGLSSRSIVRLINKIK